MLLAGSLGMPNSWAQNTTQPPEGTLKPVIIRAEAEAGKDQIKVNRSSTAKGNQELRDIPQSITVVTEKLIDDRNLDTLKEVLHNTAGVTFQAAEGGEEDIRLRGFSLASTGDIFLDGMRDPAFYERDTFNLDRVDLLRGSASMLFGRGSTGGAANQITKQPSLYGDNEAGITLGNHQYRRVTGDFNFRLAESTALRINAMHTKADNDGRGNGLDKSGLAVALRTGIGERHEFNASLSYLDNRNPRMNYGLPFLPATAPATAATPRGLIPGVDPSAYLGMDSDYNAGTATIFTAGHLLRLSPKTELKTQIRRGLYTRDQRASAIRFTNAATTSAANIGPATLFNRNFNPKIQQMDVTQLQSDFSTQFDAAGYKHDLLAGIDFTVEDKAVQAVRSGTQGGINITKPTITLGGIVTGGNNFVNEDSRVLRDANNFRAKGSSLYVQDMLHLDPQWKLVGGLRYDSMKGRYQQFNIPTNAAGPVTTVAYQQNINELSKRIGVLFQPDALHSYHFSYGTSFNTSGDTYSYNSSSANTPPEQSRNIELGAKIDSENKRFSTRYAFFYAEKFNERNTDPDTAATSLLVSGKRYSAGLEFDITGRITPQWEIYGSTMWIPKAKVTQAAGCPPAPAACLQSQPGEKVGERPGLIPKFSGTIWNTYQLTPKWRIGAGLNFRSKQKPVQSDIQAPGFGTVDLLAEYRVSDTYTVKANLNNVANKYYADTLYRGHYVPGQGRVLQVNMTARF
ncbi:TonB-dependent receptor [Variovorax sp. PCZ-1]|nr:TonB-dependent receptor [Variovorax sp. PCZ-1]